MDEPGKPQRHILHECDGLLHPHRLPLVESWWSVPRYLDKQKGSRPIGIADESEAAVLIRLEFIGC